MTADVNELITALRDRNATKWVVVAMDDEHNGMVAINGTGQDANDMLVSLLEELPPPVVAGAFAAHARKVRKTLREKALGGEGEGQEEATDDPNKALREEVLGDDT